MKEVTSLMLVKYILATKEETGVVLLSLKNLKPLKQYVNNLVFNYTKPSDLRMCLDLIFLQVDGLNEEELMSNLQEFVDLKVVQTGKEQVQTNYSINPTIRMRSQ